MNKAFDLRKRTARPHTLGGAFGILLRSFGRHASDADLAARWDEIIGPEFAGQIKLVSISKIVGAGSARPNTANDKGGGLTPPLEKKRTLTVRAAVPAMTTLLNYRREDIRMRVNKYFGYDAIGSVRIK